MMRLVLAALLVALSASPTISAQHLDEFRQAKARFYFPESPNITPAFIGKLRHQMLMGSVTNSRWVRFASDSHRTADQEGLAKSCRDDPVIFTRLSDYSFSVEANAGGRTTKDVYINDNGPQYNVRKDFERDLQIYGSIDYEKQRDFFMTNTLHNANQVVTIVQISQNVVMMINDGTPSLLARCEQ